MLAIDWPVIWRCMEVEVEVEVEVEGGRWGGRWGVAGSVIWPVPELLIERLIVSISIKYRLYRQYCVYGA
ncbi:hypothetical protein P167DRAFT_531327 [Morchella conica CCBAS932]|uniref:Uncharacterized protein n=1 Tax=Morchella conica CCBAS932 TaxID=1392247 RepID=A0A3N4L4K2_9PEZI|nr:hypothetical protein P167DRAFT_531327 [Morchella conica CCBAS932]